MLINGCVYTYTYAHSFDFPYGILTVYSKIKIGASMS